MDQRVDTPNTITGGRSRPRDWPAIIAQAVLFLIMLRTIGILPPDVTPVNFEELTEATYAVQTASGDLFNQVFWAAMAGLITIPLWRDPQGLTPYFRRISLLFVFVALCALSALWATHPDISIRRSALLVISVYGLLAAIAYCPSTAAAMRVIYAAFALALIANLASLPLPFAFDSRGLFRGVEGDKNFLGVIAALGVFVGAGWRTRITGGRAKALNLVYLGGWITMLPLTGAKTALATTVAAPLIALAPLAAVRGLRLSLPLAVILAVMAALSALALLTQVAGLDPAGIANLFVSDVSFTGRDVIWQFIIDEWWTAPVLGFGYGSFWAVGFDSPNLTASYPFIRLLTQGHNGYLDLLLVLGACGMAIFIGYLGQVVAVLSRAYAIKGGHHIFATIVLIFVLIDNTTDSSFARGTAAPWIFLLAVSFILVKAVEDRCDT